MDSLALSISLNLQYGVPLEVLISKFTHARFEPAGMTINKEIPIAKSIMDYIGRWLAIKFLTKEDAKKYHNGELVERSYNEGTMSSKGVMPAIRSTIHLSEPQLKNKEDEEGKFIQALEKSTLIPKQSKVLAPKKAMAIGATVKAPQAFQNEDAPMCHNCGSVMIRNGSCYKCLDCGETSGCS